MQEQKQNLKPFVRGTITSKQMSKNKNAHKYIKHAFFLSWDMYFLIF